MRIERDQRELRGNQFIWQSQVITKIFAMQSIARRAPNAGGTGRVTHPSYLAKRGIAERPRVQALSQMPEGETWQTLLVRTHQDSPRKNFRVASHKQRDLPESLTRKGPLIEAVESGEKPSSRTVDLWPGSARGQVQISRPVQFRQRGRSSVGRKGFTIF